MNNIPSSFVCPHCNAYANHTFFLMVPYSLETTHYIIDYNGAPVKNLVLSECPACHRNVLWLDNEMLFPSASSIPQPSVDMPEDVLKIYREASAIFANSPKASAALLRLALQMLLKHLGESGENLNKDIASLVKKGVPAVVQQAADVIRVIGNNAVHPVTISLDDNRETAEALFSILNAIVRYAITEPKNIEGLFASLPDGVREQIARRDS